MGSISKIARLGSRALRARSEYRKAKENGQVSMARELRQGVVAPGATWLVVRGAMVPVVSAVLAGVVQVADGFVAADLAAIFTPEVIDGASVVLVGAGLLWGVADWVRSSFRAGLFPKPGAGDRP